MYSFDDYGAQRLDVRRGLVSRVPLLGYGPGPRPRPEAWPYGFARPRGGVVALLNSGSAGTVVARSREFPGPLLVKSANMVFKVGLAAAGSAIWCLFASRGPDRVVIAAGDELLFEPENLSGGSAYQASFPLRMDVLNSGHSPGDISIGKLLGPGSWWFKLSLEFIVGVQVDLQAFISFEYLCDATVRSPEYSA